MGEPRMGFALLAACLLGLGEPMAVICAFSAAPSLYQNEERRAQDANPKKGGIGQKLLSVHYDTLMTYYRLKEVSLDQAMRICYQELLNFQVFKQVSEAVGQTLNILRK